MLFRGGGLLKEGDINRDEMLIYVRRITSITLLKSCVTQEDTLWLGRELVLSRSKSINNTYTTKDMRGKKEERLVRKKDGMRDLIM